MPRKRMVTRTVTTTKATLMCVDTETQAVSEQEITLSSVYKTNDAILKAARPQVETETLKAVHVKSVEQVETLYGMEEQKFIENSEVLPPRSSAEVDGAEDDNENE